MYFVMGYFGLNFILVTEGTILCDQRVISLITMTGVLIVESREVPATYCLRHWTAS
jgi:hypothetical protein